MRGSRQRARRPAPRGTPHAPRLMWLGALATLALAAMVGCQHRLDPRCAKGMTREQCLFYVARLDDGGAGQGGGDGGDGRLGPELTGAWRDIDELLEAAADMLSRGLGAELTAQVLTEGCAERPRPQNTPSGRVWACFLAQAPALRGRELSLEIGESGVAGLTGFDFSPEESEAVLVDARRHWLRWCVGSRFDELETDGNMDAFRCALPGGSHLVLARFAQEGRDLSSDLWQVSLTIMGPG